MLRNTVYGNELAPPASNALQMSIVLIDYTVQVKLRMRWCAEDLGLSLRWHSLE